MIKKDFLFFIVIVFSIFILLYLNSKWIKVVYFSLFSLYFFYYAYLIRNKNKKL
jgi:Ca2+/Na+ antiporter